MIVAGVMSGTSADGIDVALVRITGEAAQTKSTDPNPGSLRLKLLGHDSFPYPKPVRQAVLASMNAQQASVADLARLNNLLGELYADAVLATQKKLRVKAQLIGCHGQTIYHQGSSARYLGRKLAVTWQTGEAAVIAARTGIPVVSDFRPADMAYGGQGAPLVPFLDTIFYRHSSIGRIALNVGGIANLTAIPSRTSRARMLAFDTGPGNMVIDATAEKLFHIPYDRNGRLAAEGSVLEPVLKEYLSGSFFKQGPPKTAGREEFGREFAMRFLSRCKELRTARNEDIVATATALTTRSIANAIQRFARPRNAFAELIVSGGGAKNPTLLAMLSNQIRGLGLSLRLSDEFSLPSESKEAVAFALLAYQTWHRRPSNVPSATGAKGPAILGKISYA
jgi:anhydro-N-acetylmuramic acid kinase